MTPALPEGVRRLVGSAPLVGDDTGRSGSCVYRAGNAYLKIDAVGALERTARMQAYFAGKGLAAPLLCFESDGERDYLLVAAAEGVSCVDRGLRAEPARLAAVLGETARMLHETDAAGCPCDDGNERAAAAYRREKGADCPGMGLLRKDALVHGDFCLPNVFLKNWRLSAFIDLGDAGIGDRHFDLYWAMWSLAYNLHTDEWNARFLDAYGRDAVEEARLAVVARLNEE